MTDRIKVYSASKLYHFPLWRKLKEEWSEVEWVARWPFSHVESIPDSPCYAKSFWVQDEEDVVCCDVVLVYAEEGDKLKGALVEAGMALAQGKRVIAVGEHDDYSTWQFHPRVYKVASMEEARLLLKCFTF